MSLILEALRKLEREKDVPAKGFLVLPPAARPSRRGDVVLAGAAVMALLVLGIVFVWPRGAQPTPAVPPAPPVPKVARAPLLLPTSRSPEAVVHPRAAVPSPEPALPTLVLEAISERDGAPIAAINGQVVREGDTLFGARIVKIGTDSVEIEFHGVSKVVTF